ncbi:N,N'-diacetylbacillosaminyl-diphospho-undecaprenol alpha-1,3-N-acetylgalactosaminyltransferase [Campylobacter pinnipediorum subsp. caledonicus]|uniref:N, N'-diacetylbacillosaminyl-diphospho-undecaprenol alpha-1,3-N-acetylgalactosaminyltransferase n=1 Tax=Campylobacter pinnipediorum TaxID=1965231 RepID=UPI000995D4E3|nr:N,N'-diacetylbacillosaminyl-diphospho-undecaprenol alpha-1,3-N-acetylgalactosaminyltransferase [Campylobacter pinnipediorum]AQW86068.1 N,N'-diacetylbacillosaminyl-diphospho-undecaprenol alpha-1,3-N-acetylgalactosaminyltransferase [Campylobacter pinnipediorum subsp. caledonicus]
MARIGFLSHSDMSIYHFRTPIMRALKKMGHDVYAICPNGEFVVELKKEFDVVLYELNKASLNPFVVLSNANKLAKIIKQLNLDLIQTSAHKSNVFGTFAAKKAGVKKILNLVEGLGSFYIDSDIKTKIIRFMIEILYKKSLKLSDGCIFVNKSDPRYFLKQGLIQKDKVFCILSVGVDTSKFYPKPCRDFKQKKIILMVARAILHKGVCEYYQASEILSLRNDCEFVYIGDNFDGNKSSLDIEFLKSSNVKYLGARNDVCDILKDAYMLVLPSYKEGFPRTILEAMSCGVAVVASDVDGCNEAVIDGFNGLLCKVKDSKDLAKKIEVLLDDEKLALKFGENGRKLAVQEFDENIIAQKYIELYRKFIDV